MCHNLLSIFLQRTHTAFCILYCWECAYLDAGMERLHLLGEDYKRTLISMTESLVLLIRVDQHWDPALHSELNPAPMTNPHPV